jgi:hypothetical protein
MVAEGRDRHLWRSGWGVRSRVGVEVGLVGEVDGGRESAGSLGLAELGAWANQVRRDFAGAASAGWVF